MQLNNHYYFIYIHVYIHIQQGGGLVHSVIKVRTATNYNRNI